ncbi:formate dehydrogenase accessory sulfurtransferase FdhD [Methyloferula stellata]|uniref:formate dehydrogenase accessory sulfurtransferase FdhD n=1 Tax=Methyloferula stellata TaxID=876270 RepID=UPI00037B2812|nr:formate dehydrogenase accessory sulfurtransferase FdhD [Methyloferula stellata]
MNDDLPADDLPPPAPACPVATLAFRGGAVEERVRVAPEETALALTYEGGSYAVMMGTPSDLEDFAVGFSLNEGIIAKPADITSFEVITHAEGLELRMWLGPVEGDALKRRRRQKAGPVGCGLCGIESLEEAVAPPKPVLGDLHIDAATVHAAIDALAGAQVLNRETRAVHAAGFYVPGQGLIAAKEDVGRHNALDKLAGALARADVPGASGVVAVTSRLSVEMVQKAAVIGSPILVAVSAPTALAIRMAEAAGITLAGIVRGDGFEVFTHRHRITSGADIPKEVRHVIA